MLKRTPVIAIFAAMLLTFAVKFLVELPSRPFTMGQTALFYVLSYTVALGIVLLFDPKSAETKRKYLKINFYEEK